jgi:hypothetical protein
MAKPILVVAFPVQVELDEISAVIIPLERRLTDYHVIAYRASDITELNLKVLNPGESSDLDIEALKKQIKEKIFKQ